MKQNKLGSYQSPCQSDGPKYMPLWGHWELNLCSEHAVITQVGVPIKEKKRQVCRNRMTVTNAQED